MEVGDDEGAAGEVTGDEDTQSREVSVLEPCIEGTIERTSGSNVMDMEEMYRTAVRRYSLPQASVQEISEKENEEYDVISRATELGGYVEETMSGYVWDKVDSLTMSARKGNLNWRTKPLRNDCIIICANGLEAAQQCLRIFFVRMFEIIRDYGTQLLGNTGNRPDHQAKDIPTPSPDKHIALKFSPEYRLVQNSRVLVERAAQLKNTFEEIGATAMALAILKNHDSEEDHDIRLKKATVLKMLALKHSIKDQMRQTESLLTIQGNLVNHVRGSAFPEEVYMPMILMRQPMNLEPSFEEPHVGHATERAPPRKFIYESENSAFMQYQESAYVPQDEVYEEVLDPEDQDKVESAQASQHDKNDEILAVQKSVMDQLKTSLAPRRVGMIEREVEAYMKAYGKPPQETQSDGIQKVDLENNALESSHSTLHESSSSSSFEIVSDEEKDEVLANKAEPDGNKSDEDSFVFGDEDSEEEGPSDAVKSNFKACLEEALRKRGASGRP